MTKIERKLPESPVELLNGKEFAARITEHCKAAYWLGVSGCDGTALFLLNLIHSDFAGLAAVLGYNITPKPSAADDEPAEVAA